MDENISKNNISNLEIITQADNMSYSITTEVTCKRTNDKTEHISMLQASRFIGKCHGYISLRIKKGIFENEEYKWGIIKNKEEDMNNLKSTKVLFDIELNKNKSTTVVKVFNEANENIEIEIIEFLNEIGYTKRSKRKPKDKVKMFEEYGDIMMYLVTVSYALGLDIDWLYSKTEIDNLNSYKSIYKEIRKNFVNIDDLNCYLSTDRKKIRNIYKELTKNIFRLAMISHYDKDKIIESYYASLKKGNKRMAEGYFKVKKQKGE